MARGRWALAPKAWSKQWDRPGQHWWEPMNYAGLMRAECSDGAIWYVESRMLRPPGNAPRCAKCERAKAKPGRRRN